MYLLIIKIWAEECPSAYSFHYLPDTGLFLYHQMNLFPLLFKSLWLWRQNQKLLEPFQSMKIYCAGNLNMSHNINFPEIRAIRLLCCQWHISFCMVWKLREGSRVADCLPMKTCNFSNCLFILDVSSAPESCSPPRTGFPRKPVYMFLVDFGGHYEYYLLISFLGGERAVLFVWELTCRDSGPCMELLDTVPAHVLWITWQEQTLFFSSHAGCPGPCLP